MSKPNKYSVALLAAVVLAAGGCSTFKKKTPKTPVVGERIAILSSEGQVETDPELRALPMSLPSPVENSEWSQSGGNASKSMGQLALGSSLAEAWRVSIGKGSSLTARLAAEPIVAGGRGASEVTADLKAQNIRVIYSLNSPQRPRALAPDADETLETLRDRADAPKTPSALAKAGVSFAFESAGLSDPKDFVKNAAKAIKAGLAEETAIRALTLEAATIAGVADRLGAIEKGKIANLVLTDGNLFDERTKITRVFVEGRAVSLDAPPAPTGRGRGRGGNH